MKSDPIKTAICDDEELITNLLADFIDSLPEYKVIIKAYDGQELLEQLNKSEELPDVLLLDLKMKGMDGLETTGLLKKSFPTIKIIIISSHYQTGFIGHMLKLGIHAFIPKGLSPKELISIIESVYTKGFYFMKDQIEVLRSQISPKTPQLVLSEGERISVRELEVLELICQQYTTSEIAGKLFISEKTVEGHRNNLLAKTGVKNLAGLVIFAVKNQLININDFKYKPHK